MLANIVQSCLAVSVSPQPAFAPVESCAAFRAPRGVPEGDGDVIAVDPLPVGGVLWVPHGPHPVLATAVAAAIQSSVSIPRKLAENRGSYSGVIDEQ